jgi:enoyl-CoA hydratase/carnithine racemase
MRADRGFFCLPEVDIGIPFSAGMSALVQARLVPPVAHEAMTTGRRYGGTDALAKGIVDVTAAEGEELKVAVEQAALLAAKAGPTLGTIKERMYEPVRAVLRDAAANGLA